MKTKSFSTDNFRSGLFCRVAFLLVSKLNIDYFSLGFCWFFFFLSIRAMGAPLQGSRELVGKCEKNSPGDRKNSVQGQDTLLLAVLELCYADATPGDRHKHRTAQVGGQDTYALGVQGKTEFGIQKEEAKNTGAVEREEKFQNIFFFSPAFSQLI